MASSIQGKVFGAGISRWQEVEAAGAEYSSIWARLPAARPVGARLLAQRRSREVFAIDAAGVVVKHWYRVNPKAWLAALSKPSHAMHEYRVMAEAHRRGRVPGGPLALAERRCLGTYRGACLVLPLVAGGMSFEDILQDRAADMARIEGLCVQYATELGGHHRAGLLHNDFKPENVLLDCSCVETSGDALVTIDWGESTMLDDMPHAEQISAIHGDFAGAFWRLLASFYSRAPLDGLFQLLFVPYVEACGRFTLKDRPAFVEAVNHGLAVREGRHRAVRKRGSSRAITGQVGGCIYTLLQHERRAEVEAFLRGGVSNLVRSDAQVVAVWMAVRALSIGDSSLAALVAGVGKGNGGPEFLVIDPELAYDAAEIFARYEHLLTFRVT